MAVSQFWRERQAEFEKYQKQFRDLKAHWYVSGQNWWLQCGESSEGILNPPQQALDVFKAIARTIVAGWSDIRAEIASKPYPRVAANAEPWEIWLDFMRVREWGFRVTGNTRCNEYEWDAGVKDGKPLNGVRKELKYPTGDEDRNLYRRLPDGSLRRLSEKELKGKWSEDLQRYYHWLEDGAIEHVFESSARFCEELAARAFESEAAASGADGRPGLRRLNYPFCYWLHDHSHEPEPDPKAELDYWKAHVWRGYHVLIENFGRMGMAWADRHEKLNSATAGLSYDLTVLQANYVVDRGLRGDEAMRTFRDEAAALLEEITSSWRASCERLAVTFEDDTEELKDLAQPYHRVRDDLRRLLAELPAGRPPTTESPSIGTAKTYKTDFGRNVDRLRKECGWSFDELAGKTGMDKKLILGHVNEGKGARPNTVKTYAEAFTKKLNRNVSVAELES
jgi:ribosome-binding protein aMBF1 (putative translation factor)